METSVVNALIAEIRADYQIPPYTPDEVIGRAVQRCAARLGSLRKATDFEGDLIGRGYLKDFVYYDLNHRVEEFMANYGPDIRAWMLQEEIGEVADGEQG